MVLLNASPSKGPAMDREDAFFPNPRINEKTSPRGRFVHVEDPLVQKALEIIWSPIDHPLSVADIARQLPVTRRTLDRRFAEATGHSVLEEINTCRLSQARRLLEDTDLPVKNIARQAGFSSTERMRVLFVERVGMSPTEYRRHIGEMASKGFGPESTSPRKGNFDQNSDD
jgi:transcriptional regulator GlxA family with amidase domain